MKSSDLRDFIALLEQRGELVRIKQEVDPYLEMTEISDRTLRAKGPALLFENPKGYDVPVLCNLFGTPERVALGMGQENVSALRDVGELLAFLKEPEPPKGLLDLWEKRHDFKQVLNMPVKVVKKAPCQQIVLEGDQVNLDQLPIQTCWPGDAAPLVTWALAITRGPEKERQNLGIYRMQKIAKNKLIMRWLAHRGGALDYRDFQKKNPGKPYPVAIALGADPATTLGAVTNTVIPSSGKVLTGGVDAHALEKPKRFFGAARNIEHGGSLTIIATALVETGSKMDEVIYEEFKGTGNMELILDRKIAEKRVYPAINVRRSGTRREDLLIEESELQRIWILRKLLHDMEDLGAAEFVVEKLKGFKNNAEFFGAMKRK